jgi:hypothetical protein
MLRRAILFRFWLFLTLCWTLLLVYFYLKTRPPYSLYNQLNSQELGDSELLVKIGRRKYVMFKQLRGAGFNNQVRRN